jgi:hypothetical protein
LRCREQRNLHRGSTEIARLSGRKKQQDRALGKGSGNAVVGSGRAGVHGRELAAQCRDHHPKRSGRRGLSDQGRARQDSAATAARSCPRANPADIVGRAQPAGRVWIAQSSDADYPFAEAAVAEVQVLLRKVAGHFGYDENDTVNYNTKFPNPVLSQFSTERLQIIYAVHGINGVGAEVEKLKQAGMI